jgi:hypothetical protein
MNKKAMITIPAALFCTGAGLRAMLFLANTPSNAYDNHFLPIYLILKHGAIPRLDACWECYQPPVFYLVSAFVGKLAIFAGIAGTYLPKLLQSLCCLYGILHLGVIYLILRKLPLSGFARSIAFAFACFLPAHMYVSAMNSNDTASFLAMAL